MTAELLLSQAIKVFLIARQADGYSPSTLDQYRWALVRLVKQGDKKLSDVGSDDIRQFLSYLQTDYRPVRSGGGSAPLGSASIFAAWKAIRAFYKWASPEFGIRNPAMKVPMPRHAAPVIIPLSRDEMKLIVAACERTGEASTKGRKGFTMNRPTAARDKAIVLTLVDTGLRASELCRLTMNDCNLQTGEVTVRAFGAGIKSRPRMIPLGASAKKALALYLVRRVDQKGNLFQSETGDPLSRSAVLHLLVALGERAGVKDVHTHRFRHTFAIQFLRNGGDIFSLQKMLGHATLEMVQHYLDIAQSDVEAAHKRASPADNWRL